MVGEPCATPISSRNCKCIQGRGEGGGAYRAVTRILPKESACFDARCPEEPPAGAGVHAAALDFRVVTMVSPDYVTVC